MNHLARFVSAAAALLPAVLAANIAPTVVIQSASMRPGTTLMDVVYRVNDPDDVTVKTRALAFIGGVRSFANLIKPVTFAEGTSAFLGDSIATNTNHTLVWNAAADWNTDLGQIKFEILAMDGRGLLPIDWITIPAANGNAALTISKDAPADADVLNALFWQYADGDSGLTLSNGVLTGNASSGNFFGVDLVIGSALQPYGPPFILKRMNLDPASDVEVKYAAETARAGLLGTSGWHAANRVYGGLSVVIGWGQVTIPAGLTNIAAIDAGSSHTLALRADGTVVGWGANDYGQTSVPVGLTNASAIAAGGRHSLALKNDGTVVGWGSNNWGQIAIPAGLTNVSAIAAGEYHSLALKNDGTVVGWGLNQFGEITIPAGLTNVSAIAAGENYSLALKQNGTVIGWGINYYNQLNIPADLINVSAIAVGIAHNLALKGDGTVAGWGYRYAGDPYHGGQVTIPDGLTNVSAIAAGYYHSLALKTDGTVVGWGFNDVGQITIPAGLNNVSSIAAGYWYSLALKAKAP